MPPKGIDKRDFFQSKYDYYKRFTLWVIIFASLASISFFVSDCQLYHGFAWETLLPRLSILIPLYIYVCVFRRCRDYRVMVPVSYLMGHMIIWNTIWVITMLPDKSHAPEGFLIMHLIFFALGFCAPAHYAAALHTLIFADILGSHLFNHYQHLDFMLSMGIPCLIAICIAQYFMQRLYLDHYRTSRKLEHISNYDPLTGAYNRNIIPRITERDKKHFTSDFGSRCCVLLLDIDFFKEVNDTYGHGSGDRVLQSLVGTVQEVLRQEDCMIRWGGEEFVVVLAGCAIEEAAEVAERIRAAVERSDTGVCPITISVGVCAYNGEDYKHAIDMADKALYHAKENGRNRVEIYGEK